jgi:CMP-N,N'-diacetyllegionaminic acid synthase
MDKSKYKTLAIIPARGGSKSIPKKNIKLLLGKPLLAWTIEEAKKSKYIDRVVVSTDDKKIADIARQYGAETPFMRPAEISQDLSTDIEFILHAADFFKEHENYEPDIIAHLRPTSPLKTALHIDEGIEALINTPQADSVRSITESPKHPYKMWKISQDKKWIEPFFPKSFTGMDEPYNSPRQILPDVYVSTGAVDIMRLSTIRELKSVSGRKIAYFYMRPEESVNIDNPIDFKITEILMKEREKNR